MNGIGFIFDDTTKKGCWVSLVTGKTYTINLNLQNIKQALESIVINCAITKRISYFSIFTKNLKSFQIFLNEQKDFLVEQSDIRFDLFSFKNNIYSIKVQFAKYKKITITFKDLDLILNSIGKQNTQSQFDLIKSLYLFAKKYNINICHKKYISLTSVAKATFKNISPVQAKKIKSLNEKEDFYIRKSFFGGRNEIYEHLGYNVHFYDVNSLYPFVMKNYPMPVGIPKFVKGQDIQLDNFYGFIRVKVKTPDNMHLPILPIRHHEQGIIYTQGTFQGTYFSEELKLAYQFGYTILEILDGYAFEQELVFDTFVDRLYEHRVNESNSDMKKLIKLMMNSLYGRYSTKIEHTAILNIKPNLTLYTVKRFGAVSVSSAIASYSRMYIYKFLICNKLNPIYWDTDGVILKEPILDPSLIGKQLGQFRYVCLMEEVIIMAPKFYMYKTPSGYLYVFVVLILINIILTVLL